MSRAGRGCIGELAEIVGAQGYRWHQGALGAPWGVGVSGVHWELVGSVGTQGSAGYRWHQGLLGGIGVLWDIRSY